MVQCMTFMSSYLTINNSLLVQCFLYGGQSPNTHLQIADMNKTRIVISRQIESLALKRIGNLQTWQH